MNINFVEEFYNRFRNDSEYREYVIKNPKKAMCEVHGVDENTIKDVQFEVVEQDENTITILIPAKPDDYPQNKNISAKKISDQTIDFMYEHGIPGFLIPNDKLRWILLNMRRSWCKKEGVNL